MKRGDTMAGSYRCDSGDCTQDGTGWTYVDEQALQAKWDDGLFVATMWGVLATCPKCHSSRIVER